MSSPAVKVSEIQGRGRAVVASRPIKPGEILLSDFPLLLYPTATATATATASPFCSHCFRTLSPSPVPCPSSCSTLFCSPHCLSASPHSPWLCQTLARLPCIPLDPDLRTQLNFLLSAYNLAVASPSDFHRLLSLEGSQEQPSNHLLHSLLASLSPPPLQAFSFSLPLTAALLAKDKRNAFGLMEPFREEDAGERKVRAYGIYPTASFFNHDCLPNACRFDYVDAAADANPRNTEIIVRAIHDIPQGREVCLSYFPVNWGYKERQRRLMEDYGFPCECDRCQVERNWKDDDDGEEEMEGMEEDDHGDDEGMEEEESSGEGGDDGDFPHAYFFVRYQCDRENCGGTLAPLPPSPHGTLSNVMECNACGRLRKEEDVDGDGIILDD